MQGWDGGGEDLPARREAREEKDRLKAEFGARLKVLLDLTGLSSREFAARYPAYKDSTVRKYTLGTNLPPWDFLHDLLTEVARRTDDPAAPQRRTELFTAYRTVLVTIGADVRGSDQNSLLLRLLDGEETLHRLREELAEVRARENQLLADLEEARRQTASPAARERQRQLEEETRTLAHRRSELVRHRGALVADLDDCRARLAVLEEADGPGDLVPTGTRAGAGPHQPYVPPLPPAPPASPEPSKSRGRRALRLIGIAAAVVLLAGGGAAVGIWATGDRDTGDQAASPQPTTPSASATPSPTTPAPTTAEASSAAPSSAKPNATRWTGHGVALTYLDLDTVPVRVLSSNNDASVWASYSSTDDEVTLYGMNGGFFTTEPTIATWDAPAKPDRQGCADRISTTATETLPVTPGARFCVTTAEGRTAYIEVEKMDKALAAYTATITVWEEGTGASS
ncbi:hypothetical protein OG416_38855 [Streptomyces longwoodensis]|uniref:hypothetical protein n=1 Tax=Streptomyces longwoodensis TaxID=68231 RepID=UPI0030E12458|nr:hypothetical protein OG416_38855 [Streptomyces longwoodensis]